MQSYIVTIFLILVLITIIKFSAIIKVSGYSDPLIPRIFRATFVMIFIEVKASGRLHVKKTLL